MTKITWLTSIIKTEYALNIQDEQPQGQRYDKMFIHAKYFTITTVETKQTVGSGHTSDIMCNSLLIGINKEHGREASKCSEDCSKFNSK